MSAPSSIGSREQRRAGVVDEQRQAVGVRDVRDGADVGDVEPRVADRLEVEEAGVVVDGGGVVRRVGAVDEPDLDAQLGQGVVEQVVGPAVEAGAADDVLAGAGDVEDRQRLGRLAGREPERPDAALERGDPLLEHAGRRVHDPGVDVPELLEPEQPGGVRGVVEDVGGRGVDRHGAGVGRGVGDLAGVEGLGLGAKVAEAVGVEAHLAGSPVGCVVGGRVVEGPWGVWLGGYPSLVPENNKAANPSGSRPRDLGSEIPAVTCCWSARRYSAPVLRTTGPPTHAHQPGNGGVAHQAAHAEGRAPFASSPGVARNRNATVGWPAVEGPPLPVREPGAGQPLVAALGAGEAFGALPFQNQP